VPSEDSEKSGRARTWRVEGPVGLTFELSRVRRPQAVARRLERRVGRHCVCGRDCYGEPDWRRSSTLPVLPARKTYCWLGALSSMFELARTVISIAPDFRILAFALSTAVPCETSGGMSSLTLRGSGNGASGSVGSGSHSTYTRDQTCSHPSRTTTMRYEPKAAPSCHRPTVNTEVTSGATATCCANAFPTAIAKTRNACFMTPNV